MERSEVPSLEEEDDGMARTELEDLLDVVGSKLNSLDVNVNEDDVRDV